MRTIIVKIEYEVTAPFDEGDVEDIEALADDYDAHEPVFEQIRSLLAGACGGSHAMGHVEDENVRVEIEVD
jgi:hypothetical protein